MNLIRALLVCSSIICACSAFDNFITRSGYKLMDGKEEFRFISFNIPGMTVVEDPSWHLVTPWEQEDAIKTIAQIGGRVFRVYTFSIHKSDDPDWMKRHIYKPRVYDEDLFVCFDKMLELCNKYGIRVIVPFIDRWDWWGGINHFKAFRNAKDFYQDPQVKKDFQDFITDVVNRVNTFTKVKYKDDKAILAWETGNELNPTLDSNWTSVIAAHIKSQDPNHLVMDGTYGIVVKMLLDPNIDIVSNHYYRSSSVPYSERCKMDIKIVNRRKAFFVGEFGIAPTKWFEDLLNTVISESPIGTMIWSLRFHNEKGGFYKHQEGKTNFYAYHWPGFAEGQGYDEMKVTALMYDKAHKIRGIRAPPIPIPGPPIMRNATTTLALYWQGSVGARCYDLARSESEVGPWKVIATNLSDAKQVETEGVI